MLAFERQILLLLARLNVLYPQMAGTGGLHWGNLKLDGYDLAIGYEPNEKERNDRISFKATLDGTNSAGLLGAGCPDFYRISRGRDSSAERVQDAVDKPRRFGSGQAPPFRSR